MTKWLRIGGAAVLGAGLVLGLSACGGTAGASSPAATPSASAPTTSGAPAPHKKKHDGTTGQITSENGDSWVITTKANKQVTVTITASTKFGTTARPATAQQFPVGTTIRVIGTTHNGAVTATSIRTPQPPASQSATPAPTPTS